MVNTWGPTLNDILTKLTNACYMITFGASEGYDNSKLVEYPHI